MELLVTLEPEVIMVILVPLVILVLLVLKVMLEDLLLVHLDVMVLRVIWDVLETPAEL